MIYLDIQWLFLMIAFALSDKFVAIRAGKASETPPDNPFGRRLYRAPNNVVSSKQTLNQTDVPLAGPQFNGPNMQDSHDSESTSNFQTAVPYDAMETFVCPTTTQTVYFRPKTVTKTLTVLHSSTITPMYGAGQSYNYVTVPGPDRPVYSAVYPDNPSPTYGDEREAVMRMPVITPTFCVPIKQAPSTEFRSFVYLSTQVVHSTKTEYLAPIKTVTVKVPVTVTVQAEPVTRFQIQTQTQTITIPARPPPPPPPPPPPTPDCGDLQPSKQYAYAPPAGGLPIIVVSTETVTLSPECPLVDCRGIIATVEPEPNPPPQRRYDDMPPMKQYSVADIRPTKTKRCKNYAAVTSSEGDDQNYNQPQPPPGRKPQRRYKRQYDNPNAEYGTQMTYRQQNLQARRPMPQYTDQMYEQPYKLPPADMENKGMYHTPGPPLYDDYIDC